MRLRPRRAGRFRSTGDLALVVSVLAGSGPLGAQASLPVPDHRPATAAECRAIGVTAATHQRPVLPATARAFAVRLWIGGRAWTLRFEPHDVRTPDHRLVADDGERRVELGRTPVRTLRGSVDGVPGARAAASLLDDGLSGAVRGLPGGGVWGFQPLPGKTPAHLTYRDRDVVPDAGRCGNVVGRARGHERGGGGASPGALKIAELALDCDFDLYVRNGRSVARTQDDAHAIVNLCNLIYIRDLEIRHDVTATVVRTAPTYTTTAAAALLSQFQSRWNSSHGGIKRDVAHLFTGRSLDGNIVGFAFVGTVCNGSTAYGLSETHYTANLVRRVALTAHELGHNWNAGHCSGSSCTIMCPTIGGCGGPLDRFGPASVSAIRRFRDSRGCLSDPPGPRGFTTPSNTRYLEGDRGLADVLGTAHATTLQQVDRDQLGIVFGIKALHWRRDADAPAEPRATARVLDLEVQLGSARIDALDGHDLDGNWLTKPTTVFTRKKLNAPPWTAQPGAAPAPFDLRVAFDAAFTHIGMPDRHLAYQARVFGNSATGTPYPFDFQDSQGSFEATANGTAFGAGCKGFMLGSRAGNRGTAMVLEVSAYNAPPSTPVFAHLDLQAVDLRPPFLCAPALVLPAATLPLGTADALGLVTPGPRVVFPHDARLIGKHVFLQGLALDPTISPGLGLRLSSGSKVSFPADPQVPDVGIVYHIQDTAASQPRVVGPTNGGIVTLFEY